LSRRYEEGVASHRAGDLRQAAAAYGEVLGENPDHLPARNNLAAALADLGQFDEARACYRRGLQGHPDSPELHANFGNLLRLTGDLSAAADHYFRAVTLAPEAPGAHEVRYALGIVLRTLGRRDDAVRELQLAAQAMTTDPRPWSALAALALDIHDLETAAQLIDEALARNPTDADTLNLQGIVYKQMARFGPARSAFDAAIGAAPDHAEARYNRGALRLLMGDMPAAWEDFEWRWFGAGGAPLGVPEGLPRWQGEPLAGRTVLLAGEQGFGDTIQFVRYAPHIHDKGGRVLLRCRPELHRLLKTAPGVDTVCGLDEPAPKADFYLPLLSLAALCQTEPATMPSPGGYLAAPASRRPPSQPLRVGLVWSGSPSHGNDANRSVPLRQLTALLAVPAVRFFSLQMGPAREQLADLSPASSITDLTDGLQDFFDTAAQVAGLDLLITVDTAVAHLAGAMGRPAWVLLPHVPDWRWALEGAETPWYRSLRLFRQKASGDWRTPVASAVDALTARTRR